MTVIDVHAHLITDELVAALAESGMGRTPSFIEEDNGEISLAFDGQRKLGPIPDSMRRVDARLADMQRQGVDVQVLAVAPMLYGYDEEPGVAEAVARNTNDCLLDVARASPDHFSVLASLPLRNPEASLAELDRLAGDPFVQGVQIGSHIDGMNLDDPSLEPVWESLAAKDMTVLVHPYKPAGRDRLTRHYLVNLIGNPLDSTIAIASLIFGGVLARHEDLRFCFVHGGGFAPYQIGRWDHGWKNRAENKGSITRAPSDFLRQMFFDTLTHDPVALAMLGAQVGWDRVVLGSDYPFDMADKDPVGAVKAIDLADDDLHKVLETNALELLRNADPAPAGGASG